MTKKKEIQHYSSREAYEGKENVLRMTENLPLFMFTEKPLRVYAHLGKKLVG